MSLAGFISATSHCINRHVQRISENDEGSSRRYIDIVKGVEFRELLPCHVHVCHRKEPKREGKGGTDHKIPMSEGDLFCMNHYFDTDHPVKYSSVIKDVIISVNIARVGCGSD